MLVNVGCHWPWKSELEMTYDSSLVEMILSLCQTGIIEMIDGSPQLFPKVMIIILIDLNSR